MCFCVIMLNLERATLIGGREQNAAAPRCVFDDRCRLGIRDGNGGVKLWQFVESKRAGIFRCLDV